MVPNGFAAARQAHEDAHAGVGTCRYDGEQDVLVDAHGYCRWHGGRPGVEAPYWPLRWPLSDERLSRVDEDAWAAASRHDWNEGPR